MSVYYSLDGGEPNDLASNTGYGDLCRWIDTLAGCPGLSHLRNYGWEQDLAATESQLRKALSDSPPPGDDVLRTARGLLAALRGRHEAEVMTINNGIVAAGAEGPAAESKAHYAPLDPGDEPDARFTLPELPAPKKPRRKRE